MLKQTLKAVSKAGNSWVGNCSVLPAEPSPKFHENKLPALVGTDKSWKTTVLSNWN
jgi:hypothetical protein